MSGSEHHLDLDKLAQASFQLTSDAFYWMRKDGRFVLTNSAACRQLGYSLEQLTTMTVFDIDHLMTRDMWDSHWEDLASRQSFVLPSVHRRADGSLFPVEVTVNYITTDQGAFNCAMVRDVTEQEQQQRIAKQHEALKTATIDCALDSVISINEQGTIVEFNPAAEATFGHAKAEVLGRQLGEVVIPHDMREAHEKGLQHFLKTGVGPVLNQRLELPALHANGSTFPVEIAISPIDVAGKPMFTAYIRDITQRKQAEQALTDARASAELANEHKSRFLAQMSHEIRTPLTAIVGYADLLTQSKRREDTQLDWGSRIQENTRYLLALVNDILDLSKIEAGESTLHTATVNLADTLRSVDAMLRPRATEKLLDFQTEFTTAIPKHVQIDGTKLKQIIVNLAVNAIRATTTGHVGIRMAVVPTSESAAECTIEVHDSGCGIEKEYIEQIFQPFIQVESHKQGDAPGQTSETGLGLAISQQFARLLGGELSCVSEVGQGSTFTLKVPVDAPQEYVDTSAHANQMPPRVADAPSLEASRILVVDDNPDNQQILRYLLEPTGAAVEVANNGSEALNMIGSNNANAQPYNLILLDMQMPVMDGYTTIKVIRENGLSCRVIAVTAFATTGEREKCLAAGCDDYLTKPVEPAALYAAITKPSPRNDEPTNPPPHAEFTGPRFARIRDNFIASLSQQHAKIRDHLTANELKEVGNIVHQLKGTGTSFGFPEITNFATACESVLAAGEDANSAIHNLLTTLSNIIERHGS